MALNKESNVYTILFAVIMVVIVGGGLAAVAIGLKPAQQANVLNEKKQNIIQATGFFPKEDVVRDKAEGMFADYVTKRIILDFNGVVTSELAGSDVIDPKNMDDAFNVDMRKEYGTIKNKEDRHYPLFVCEKDGKTVYVISCSGKGLWDDIWGYVGYDPSTKQIVAAKFDHKGETAGLGSLINEAPFQDQFVGKSFSSENGYKKISVVKPGSAELDAYTVDGISGATFSGKGVDEMMERNFEVYYKYFNTLP